VKRENNLQGDKSFNDLQNMLFLVSSLGQVAKEQMTVLGRLGVYICITFWVEVNVNKVYMLQATFFRGGCCIHSILYLKNLPPLWFWPPCCKILLTGLSVVNVTAISWVKFSSFGRHKTKNSWYTMFSIAGCPALQHNAHIFSAKPAYINAQR